MDNNLATKLPKLQLPNSIQASRNQVLGLFLLIVVGVLVYMFLLTPKLAEVKAKQTQLDQVTAQQQSIQSDVKTLQDLSKKLNESATDISHLDQALPLNEREIRTQLLIEQLVRSSGVLVGGISVNDTNSGVAAGNLTLLKNPFAVQRTLGQLTVNADVSGDFGQLLDLIKKLENYGRLMDISSLNLSASGNGQLNMRLTFTMYYFSPPSS